MISNTASGARYSSEYAPDICTEKSLCNHYTPCFIRVMFFLCTTYLLLITAGFSQELVTDRPDQTESSAVVSPGHLQVETGFLYEKDKKGGLEAEGYELLGTLFRLGLSESVELRLKSGYLFSKATSGNSTTEKLGINGVTLGTKIFLLEEQGYLPAATVLINFDLPIGKSDFVSERIEPGFLFTADHTVTDKSNFAYNLGASFPYDEDFDVIYSAVFGFDAGAGTGIFIEGFGKASADSPHQILLDTGTTWLYKNNVQFDISIGIAVSKSAPDLFAGAGLSFRIPK